MHPTQFYCLGHLCAKNYQNWWKFDEVLAKTILTVFLRHGVFCWMCSILYLYADRFSWKSTADDQNSI